MAVGGGVAVGGCSAVGKELAQSESGSNITRLEGGALGTLSSTVSRWVLVHRKTFFSMNLTWGDSDIMQIFSYPE